MANDDSEWPYLRIARALKAAIEAGDPQPGERLASTRSLAKEHGVSAMTVSSALQALNEAGLVEVRGTSGVFVRPSKEWGPLPTKSSQASLAESVRQLTSELADLRSRLERLESTVDKKSAF